MLAEQMVKVKWTRRTKTHFESKGYTYTKIDEEFEVNVHDLTSGSHTHVKFICDYCNGKNQIEESSKWKAYKKLLIQRKTTNKDCCSHGDCKNKKVHETFINNLFESKETLGHKFPNLINEWSSKNSTDPFMYSHGSEAIVWWECKNNHEWKDSVLHRTNGRGCPICGESKGEQKVRKFLEINKINFEAQYDIKGLIGVNGGLLKFDFSILDSKNNLICLIEYDGEFHFGKYFEDQKYENTLIHDERKNNYCKNSNIPLLRIPYWQFDNIEEILHEELIKYKLII
jgi:hypothetical protein